MKRTVLLALLLIAPTLAAEDSWYVGGGLGVSRLDLSIAEPDMTSVYLMAGFRLSDWLGIEARAGHAGTGTDALSETERYRAEVRYHGTALVRLDPLSWPVRPYLLGGGTHASLEVETPTASARESESGATWGGGLALETADGILVQLEYLRYLDEDAYRLDAANLGVALPF